MEGAVSRRSSEGKDEAGRDWHLRYETFCIGSTGGISGISGISGICLLDAFIPFELSAILPDMPLEAATMSLAVGAGLSAWCGLLGFLTAPLVLAVLGVVDNQGIAGAAAVVVSIVVALPIAIAINNGIPTVVGI